MIDLGANKYALQARLVGGAMIGEDVMNIGAEVIKSVTEILGKNNTPIVAQKTGGNASRAVTLDVATGILWYTENGGVEKML